MTTVFTEGLIKGRCCYCFYGMSEKGVDVATAFTEGLRMR